MTDKELKKLKDISKYLHESIEQHDLLIAKTELAKLDRVIDDSLANKVETCQHEWVSSVAYKGAKICTACGLYR